MRKRPNWNGRPEPGLAAESPPLSSGSRHGTRSGGARNSRIAERTATKLAIEAQQAALAAAQAAEAAAREAALRAEQARNPAIWNSLSGPRGKPPWKKSGRPLATPAMLPVKLGNEKTNLGHYMPMGK